MKNIFGLFLIIIVVVGCEKLDVPFLSDTEEIERYIADSDLGHDFFRNDNIISGTPYFYPLDSNAVYTDTVTSKNRIINVIVSTSQNPDLTYADVKVTDVFTISTTRIKAADTSVFESTRLFERNAYFEKLGDDGQRFSGWLIRGFNGRNVTPGSVSNLFHSNTQIFNNIYDNSLGSEIGYKTLTGIGSIIERINDGEILKAQMIPSSGSFMQLLSAETQNGFVYEQFIADSTANSSIQFTTPSNRSQTWGIIIFEEFLRASEDSSIIPQFDSLDVRIWCEPFRVN